MPKRNTLQAWLLDEAKKIAREHLRDIVHKGMKQAGPALKKIGNHAQTIWPNRGRTKKTDMVEIVNDLQRELYSEKAAHAKTRAELKRALAKPKRKGARSKW